MDLSIATILSHAQYTADIMVRVKQIMAALEVGHVILADQDDYDIATITVTLFRDTIDMSRAAVTTLTYLRAWT